MKGKDSYDFNNQVINGDNKLNELDDKKLTENEEPEVKQEEEVPGISFFKLFRYSTLKDKIFIYLAIISAIISGCTLPINMLIFAQLLQAMIEFGEAERISEEGGDAEAFMSVVTDFAINNTILGIVLVVGGYLATVLMNIAAFNQVYKIRQEYLKAAMNQDFEYFDLHQTGDFASKMAGDVIKVEDGIGEKLTTFIYYQASFLSAIIMALIRGWELALICLASFPITMILVGTAGFISSRLSKQESVVSGKAASVAEEVIAAIRTVYAFSGQTKEEDRYKVHLEDVKNINIKKGFFNGLAMGFLMFCIFCTYGMAFWFGFQFLINKNFNYSPETVIAVFFSVLMGSANFGISTTIMEVFGTATGAGAKIFHLIDNIPTINPLVSRGVTPNSVEGNVELRDVYFHYPSRPDVPVLKGVNISVKKGQTVALVGHSGCGKSTIVQLISRNYDVVDGTVLMDGNDVRDLSVRWLREQIGLVGQEPVLFNNTVRENIRYGRQDATDEEIEQVAKVANAHNFIMKLPKGYDTIVGERGTTISGGQKQRVAIARALIRDPAILLLDEATSALDTASEVKVQRALDKAAQGRTTIIIAHRLSTIRNVDLIYVFKNGVVTETGNHDELMKQKGHYYEMVLMQTLPEIEGGENNKGLKREVSQVSEKEEEEIEDIKGLEEVKEPESEDVSFWRVLKLNSPEWRSITLASTCALLNGLSMPLLALLFAAFIGTMSRLDDIDAVTDLVRQYALIFVGIGVFSGVMSFVQVYMYEIAGEHLTERLRQQMFAQILRQEVAFFDDKANSTGALCAKLSGEAAQVQGATGQRIGTILQAVGTFGFALILAMIFEWRVGLVSLTFVPLIAVIMFQQGRMISDESFGTAKTMENSSKIAIEAVSNIRTVASLGREPKILEEYAAELVPAVALATRATHWRGIITGLSRGLFNFVYAGAMYYSGTLIVDGVSYESVLKSVQVLLMGASSATNAFAFAPNFQKGILAAGRIIVLLKRETKIADPAKPAVENFNASGEAGVEKVFFRYPTRPTIPVLKGLELDIHQGKTLALVGASGCGKSTVIQLIERYYDADEGVVTLDKYSLRELRLIDARKGIGLVQQEPVLFDRTIAENIAYGDNSGHPSIDEIIDSAKQANIHNFVTSLPMGYDTNIGSKGTQLSGGQKQRVAIARALLRKPKILLLDEATSALDSESEKVVQEALDKAKAGRTCVTIAHRLSTIRDADVICVVHAGRVAELGTHQELMASQGLYYMLNQRGYS